MMHTRNNIAASIWMSLATKPANRLLCLSVMLAALVIGGIENADAQVTSGTVTGYEYEINDNSTYNVYINISGGTYLYQGSVPCPGEKPRTEISPTQDNPLYLVWKECQYAAEGKYGLAQLIFSPPPPIEQLAISNAKLKSLATPKGQSGATPALTLSSSTPYLPFLGNRLVVMGYVPDAAVFANATAGYDVGLRREADCSLAEDFVLPGAATPNAGLIASLPAAQDYFHQLSGLTTTADVFARGCKLFYGQPSSTGQLLQPTSDGGSIVAELPSSLQISVDDPVANTITTTTLLSSTTNPSLGALSAVPLTSSGNMDVVATFATDPATQQFSTAVFLGNGDGTFKSGVYFDIAGDITIDDVNGDGIPDIVICGLTSGITTLIGRGDGTFTPTALSAAGITPCGPASGQVLTGDFNGDGKKDLLVHDTVLLGHGDGSFTVGTPVIANATFFFDEFGNTAVGDLNKDGKLDVVINQPGYVAVFYGNGDGTFATGPRYAALPGLAQVNLADVDGDGNLDIVLGTGTGGTYTSAASQDSFQILMGWGDGTFVDSVVYNQGHYGNGGTSTVVGPQIATADFNGDGHSDALVFTPANGGTVLASSLAVLPGDGTGKLGTPIISPVTVVPTMLVTASINTDGRADVVLAGSVAGGPVVSVLLNQGSGTFAGELDYTLPSPAVSLVTGDFNGDGFTDVAVGVNPGSGNTGVSGVYVLLGQANGTFAAPVKVDSSVNPTGLAAADINGDGRTDLVVADQGASSPSQVNGALHVYLGAANGTFTAATAPTTTATYYSVVALGDLNKDGKLDLIVGGDVAGAQGAGTPNVYTLLGNGDGTFRAANATALTGPDGIGATSIALADFNKDGHLDVAIGNATDFTEVLLGNGDGTLVDTILALGQQPLALAGADLNGDGFPELLVGMVDTTTGSNLAVFINANAWTVASAPGSFILSLSSAAGTVTAGLSATTTISVTPGSGFTGSVSLSCSGLPTGATCNFSPASLTVNGSAVSSALTITTTARTAMNSSAASFKRLAPGGLLLAGFGLPIAWRRRRDIARLAYNGFPVLLLVGVIALPGCGGGSGSNAPVVSSSGSSTSSSSSGGSSSSSGSSGSGGGLTGTPAGAYAVTVTATSGSVTQTTTYTLTVD
jgi:hypothetical protein